MMATLSFAVPAVVSDSHESAAADDAGGVGTEGIGEGERGSVERVGGGAGSAEGGGVDEDCVLCKLFSHV